MSESTTVRKRLVESPVGVLLAAMLGVLWLVSMAVVDGQAVSFYPAGWGLLAVVLGCFVAQVVGYKVVRISLMGWLGLAAGAYFLLRCLYSPSTVASWQELGLIVGAFVFYVAGIYAAQKSDNRFILVVLLLAVGLNLGAYWLMQSPDMSIRVLGRPEEGLTGPNARNVNLFVYKNFAGLSFVLFGMLLIWYTIWRNKYGVLGIVCLLSGLVSCFASFYCDTRIIMLALPLMGVIGVALWAFLCVYQKKSLNLYQIVLLAVCAIALLIFIADLFLGQGLLNAIFDVNSHLRFEIWALAWSKVADASLFGFGAAEAQWVFSPTYNFHNLPNYVHNEYLQVWVDYGLIGVLLMLMLIIAHALHGLGIMASEHVERDKKLKTAMAFLCLITMAFAAMTDFVWHNFSLVALTAFACGILATPYVHAPLKLFDFRHWAPGSGGSIRPLRAQNKTGKVVMLALMLAVGCCISSLTLKLKPAWQLHWQFDELCAAGADASQKRSLLCQSVAAYPDHALGDNYACLAAPVNMNWPAYEQLLRTILNHCPRQIFTATMLAEVLDQQHRFEEAEAIYRQYYIGDGQDNRELRFWADNYALHLFSWGNYMTTTGNLSCSVSLFSDAEKIIKSGPDPWLASFNPVRDKEPKWRGRLYPRRRPFVRSCLTDLYLYKSLGIQPDDSWKRPLQPGGKAALYSRYTQAEK